MEKLIAVVDAMQEFVLSDAEDMESFVKGYVACKKREVSTRNKRSLSRGQDLGCLKNCEN